MICLSSVQCSTDSIFGSSGSNHCVDLAEYNCYHNISDEVLQLFSFVAKRKTIL